MSSMNTHDILRKKFKRIDMNDKYEWEQVHSSMMPNRELQPEVPAEETRRIWCEELLC